MIAKGHPALAGQLVQGESRFKLLGRHADLVNIAGNRASLSDLNLKLNAIDGVRDGVFIMPDNQADDDVQRVAALVVACAIFWSGSAGEGTEIRGSP